ncbi:hypothetical protein [Oceanicoccus sp. KOV_DT_Chl]|uniref:hypothetical protein n=1 Tax=Oceanicoccus sp. KOV_DT_Chl TaxID=1904639 RepID=UPI000C7B4FE3|nr:hypothetical protein [Oceanicoccus sp. KOV_DT_Chl]
MTFLLIPLLFLVEVYAIIWVILEFQTGNPKRKWWFIPLVTPPMQLGFGIWVPNILFCHNGCSEGDGLGLIIWGAVFGIAAGFIIVPSLYFLIAAHTATCQNCKRKGIIEKGDQRCRKCGHTFTEEEMALIARNIIGT